MSMLEKFMNFIHRTDDRYYEFKDGLWYFWDETWSSLIGGYKTKKEARKALDEYCREYLGI